MKCAPTILIIIATLATACAVTPTKTSIPIILPVSNPTFAHSATPDLATRTSPPQAKCPVENPNLVPNFSLPQDPVPPPNLEEPILDFLNAGGSRHTLIDYLGQIGAAKEEDFLERDLTGDGVPELLVGEGHLRIYTCRDQKYYTAVDLAPYTWATPSIIFIDDMNLDRLPEIVIERPEDGVVDVVHDYQILEWDGEQFKNLITPENFENRYMHSSSIEEGWIVIGGVTRPLGSSQWAVNDTDNNGTLELILSGGISVNNEGYYMGPWRVTTTTYIWDGNNFILHNAEYEPAQFRFQAMQDADYAMVKGQYDEALKLYQDVIWSDTLAWWSEEMRGYVTAKVADSDIIPTPTLPAPDLKEHDNLAAYAFYRILLLHVLRGNLSDAQASYDTLQNKFPANHEGHAYAELGRIFWTTYQTSQNIRTACDSAIKFADEHRQEILYYIGSNVRHGWQSFYYEPEDICPFK
jgi:hypothetical protein